MWYQALKLHNNCFFFVLMTAPVVYRSSQCTSWMGAAALACDTATATLDLSCTCDLRHSLWQLQILNLLRDWGQVSSLHPHRDSVSRVFNLLSHNRSCCNNYYHQGRKCQKSAILRPDLKCLLINYLWYSFLQQTGNSFFLLLLYLTFTLFVFEGFCLPKEFMEDSAGEGATEFHDYEGGGIGEGEGMKDVSDQIENEEQVSFQKFFSIR